MNTSSRFAVAVHTLAYLAASDGQSVTSEMVAESVNTNAVVIRRILGSLREANLVASQSGSGGGWTLRKKPEQISLRDIYCVVEEEPLFAMHHRPPNQHCDIGRNMQRVLEGFFTDAQTAMEERLAKVSLAQVMRAVWQELPAGARRVAPKNFNPQSVERVRSRN